MEEEPDNLNHEIYLDPSLILNNVSNYDRDRKNLSNAAHVSNALKDENHRRTLEKNIQKSLHNTLQLNNIQLNQQQQLQEQTDSVKNIKNSISNNSQSASDKNINNTAKVQIKSDKSNQKAKTQQKQPISSSNNIPTKEIIQPQIINSVQQIKPQFMPHLPTIGGSNAMNIKSVKKYNIKNFVKI